MTYKKINYTALILAIIAIIIIVASFFLFMIFRTYDKFEVEDVIKVKNASSYHFLNFNGNLLKYGNNGAILKDFSGKIIWNESFEMNNPKAEKEGKYILIYDKGGSKLLVFSQKSKETEIATTKPINYADVSQKGVVACILKDTLKSKIDFYTKEGDIIASGEIYLKNAGYPTGIALSPDGEKLMVSSVGFSSGQIYTTIYFYNFGKEGKNSIDNIVAKYKYKNTIIPDIDILPSGKALAIGSDKILIFNSKKEPTVQKEIKLKGNIKSVTHNNKYVSFVIPKANKDGVIKNIVQTYSLNGFKRYEKELDFDFRKIKLMDDNELLFTDGHNLRIYNIFGIQKFKTESGNEFYDIINKKAGREYYFVKENEIQKVKLTN